MSFFNDRISTLALVSSCQMLGSGLQALVDSNSELRLSWIRSSCESVSGSLFVERIDLLIFALHVHQSELFYRMRLLRTLHTAYPDLRILVIVDVHVSYLISQLREWGLEYVVSLAMPLCEWSKSINAVIRSDSIIAYNKFNHKLMMPLSPAELCVLRFLIRGIMIDDIAKEMMRCIKTIQAHKITIMKKIGIKNDAQFIAMRSIIIDRMNEQGEGICYRMVK
jgi:two-component system capsular synthesis response regulator RcsB